MTISSRNPTTFDTNKFVPEIFSKDVIEAVKSKLVCVGAFNSSYKDELKKGDTLYIPKTNTATAYEITVGKELSDSNAFNTTAVTLSIDYWYGAKHTIDEMTVMQSQVDVESEAVKENSYAISKRIDTSINALFSALNGSSVAGTDGSAWTDAILIAAVEKLDSNDVPDTERVWIGDPSVKADIMGIDKFVRVDYGYGEQIPTGMFRKDIYGAPLLITNNLTAASTGSYGVYAHKKAIAIVIQSNLKSFIVPKQELHQTILETDALWGVVEVMDTFGYPIYTRAK